MVVFDGYTASVRGVGFRELCALVDGEAVKAVSGRGKYGYGERISFRDSSGAEVAAVSYGGMNAKTPMIECKGDGAQIIVPAIRAAFPSHSCSRVDAAYDVSKPGAFDELLVEVLAVKAKHKLKGEKRGDWDDHPEDGRTMYLGAPTSPVRARLYEKGLTKGYRALGHRDWARLEVQVRPTKEAKKLFATLTPVEVWGASRSTRDLAARVLGLKLEPFPAGTVRKESSTERKRRNLVNQYGRPLLGWIDEAGDLDSFRAQVMALVPPSRSASKARPAASA